MLKYNLISNIQLELQEAKFMLRIVTKGADYYEIGVEEMAIN